MNYNIPEKAQSVGSSGIRDAIQKASSIKGCISFGIGNPADEAIPTKELLEAINEITLENPMQILKYGPFTGYKPLHDLTVKHLVENKNMPSENQMLTFTTGSGHGLGLVPRTICNEGDVVFAEEFTFPNGVNAAKAVGCVVKGIKMDEWGMIPLELEKEAKKGKGRYIYLIPNFQNPTGRTMPLARRKEIYEIACKHNLIIYEDDPYGEIRFLGEHIPSFKSFDTEERVIFAGSYSKVMSAGLRVGYLYGNCEILEKIDAVKASSDGQSPLLNQMIIYQTLQKFEYAPYIQNICDIYGRKCKIMVESLKKYCSDKITFSAPEGGMFLWLDMPENISGSDFFEKCLEKGVAIIHSSAFLADETKKASTNSFRLNYTSVSDEDIKEGIKRLGEVTHEFIN